MTLVNKITQASGARSHSTSPVHCVLRSLPQVRSPSTTIYAPAVTTLLSVSTSFSLLPFLLCTISWEFKKKSLPRGSVKACWTELLVLINWKKLFWLYFSIKFFLGNVFHCFHFSFKLLVTSSICLSIDVSFPAMFWKLFANHRSHIY